MAATRVDEESFTAHFRDHDVVTLSKVGVADRQGSDQEIRGEVVMKGGEGGL